MIKSNAELVVFREKLAAQRKQVVEYRAELERLGLPDSDIRRALEPVEAFGERLQSDIATYERLRAGELPRATDLEQLGEALIAARLSLGVSQRELATRLGVNESLISRDEKDAYRGITLERATKMFAVLGLRIRCEFELVEAKGHANG